MEIMKLKNGMRLVMVDMPGLNSLTVLAMVGVGSRFEDKNKAGISHFLEHLPFKGTKNYPTSLDVAEAVDGVGGKHNAFTSKEYTGYWVKLASNKLNVALDVVSDLLLTARLREEDIERESGVIVEELNMYEDEPQAKVSELYDELVFAGSPLADPVIGTRETVMSLRKADFLAHWNQWYDPSNVVVGVVGGLPVNEVELVKLVEEYFSKGSERKGGGKRTLPKITQENPRLNVFFKDTEQAHLVMGYPGLSRLEDKKDKYVMSVLTTILGGNSSSRLFNEIREKRGLAYYAYASSDTYEDAGTMYAFEGVTVGKIDEAIKVTLDEFEHITTKITQKEFNRAKEYLMGKITLDLEDSASMANAMVSKALLDSEVMTLTQIMQKIEAVELSQVLTLAKRIVDPKRLNLAIVGPYKEKERFERIVGGESK